MALSKIQTKEELARTLPTLKDAGKTVVFTNGCFDILHLGHVDYLEKAKALGSILILGLNSDQSIKEQGKGELRPIVSFPGRAGVMAGLASVDYVVEFGEKTPIQLIQALQPDILVKGADYSETEMDPNSPKYIVGKAEMEAWGGKVKTIEFLDGFSTSAIVHKIEKHAANRG
ncbi:MAG: rfaE bifunctional protein nucleotidyltransferase chain/domain [Sphingobacteriales bacterium]|jgi:rfaE bifunctional protein nucleotidyltransferase chain/domain